MPELSTFTNTISGWFSGANSTSSTTDSVSTIQTNDSFSNWMTSALTSDTETTLTTSMSGALETGLASAMGINGTGLDLSSLASDSSMSLLQSSLLTALQSDLLLQASSGSTNVSVDTSEVSADETPVSIFSTIYATALGEDGATLDDLFDTVNILNHIPIVSDIYEGVSDNHVDLAASVVGGYLYGGTLGMAYEGIDFIVEQSTGMSMFENLKYYTREYWSDDGVGTTVDSELTDAISDTVENKVYEFVTRN